MKPSTEPCPTCGIRPTLKQAHRQIKQALSKELCELLKWPKERAWQIQNTVLKADYLEELVEWIKNAKSILIKTYDQPKPQCSYSHEPPINFCNKCGWFRSDKQPKPQECEKHIPCKGEWHTLSYDEYAKKHGGMFPRSCPECHSCFNPKPEQCEHHWLPPVKPGDDFICEKCGVEKRRYEMQNKPEQSELLPCPFCGGEAQYYKRQDLPKIRIECMNTKCNFGTEFIHTKEAIIAWNTRKPSPVPAIDELEAIIRGTPRNVELSKEYSRRLANHIHARLEEKK